MKFGEDVARRINFVVGVSIEPIRPGLGAIRYRVERSFRMNSRLNAGDYRD